MKKPTPEFTLSAVKGDQKTLTTYGIKYLGSKTKLLQNILGIVESLKIDSVLDGFSGTTRVSQALNCARYSVTCCDLAHYSKAFAIAFLLNRKQKEYFEPIIKDLNRLRPRSGFFTKNYSRLAKQPFQEHNLKRLDSILYHIQDFCKFDRSVLLTTLLLALDKVDNTLGHFSSYLSQFSSRSYNRLRLELPLLPDNRNSDNRVYCGNVLDIVGKYHDLAYFDPPYGSGNKLMPSSRVRYAGYYHFYNSVCLNDNPKLFGKVGRRLDSSDRAYSNPFESFIGR